MPSLLLMLLAVRCASSALSPIVVINPQLDSLVFSDFATVWPDGGILAVGATLTKSSPPLQERERIAVQVIVTSGDSERVMVESAYVFPGPRARTLVSVLMRTGHTTDELNEFVSGVPARWWLISSQDRTTGSFRVFDSRLVDGALAMLSRDPRVADAVRDPVGFAGDPPDLTLQLFGSAPLDYGEPRPNDGIVQGQKGDVIVFKYLQPSGSILADSTVMQ